jgi:hypothetical protein
MRRHDATRRNNKRHDATTTMMVMSQGNVTTMAMAARAHEKWQQLQQQGAATAGNKCKTSRTPSIQTQQQQSTDGHGGMAGLNG